MEVNSTIFTSPSFNSNSSNKIADIADRVVLELLTQNISADGDVFSFTDDRDDAGDVKTNPDEDEHEFEFPVMCGDSNLCRISTDELVSSEQISPRYPVFDRSLLSDLDLNLCNGSERTSKTDFTQPPATRLSLMKLFDEDRETVSTSNSSSEAEAEADELDGILPETYCVWKPKTEPTRGKHKKSNSISIGNTSNRWKVRDLLKRSYSDDNYSSGKDSPVLLFIPPISPNRKNGEKVNQIGKTGKVGSTKTEKKFLAYKSKIGNVRLSPYLPYREDQLAAFANYTGPNRNMYRC